MNRKKVIRSFFIAVCVWCSVPGICTGNEYYVSPTGSGGNPGTWDEPWSLFKANNSVQPGDTILLKDGTYNTQIEPMVSGNKTDWITYRAVNLQQALITNVTAGEPAIELTDRSYIMIDSVKAMDTHRWIVANNAHHFTVTNCHFENVLSAQGWENCRLRPVGDYVTFTNNSFINGSDLLSIRRGAYHYFENNYFEKANHACLVWLGVQNSVLRGNTLINPIQKLMEYDSTRDAPERISQYNLFEGNTFGPALLTGAQYVSNRTIVRKNIFKQSQQGVDNSCYRGGDKTPEAWHHMSNRFYHNVFVDNNSGGGIMFTDNMPNFGDDVFINNIVWRNTCTLSGASNTVQISVDWDALPCKIRFYHNNIMYQVPGQDIFFWTDAQAGKNRHSRNLSLVEYESFYPNLASGNIEVDPLFVDPDSGDFHLQPASLCINAGGSLTATHGAGTGTVIRLKDSTFFTDGYGITDADIIRVGNEKVTVVSIDYQRNRVEVDRSITWNDGDPVYLDYQGDAPDLGAFEFVE